MREAGVVKILATILILICSTAWAQSGLGPNPTNAEVKTFVDSKIRAALASAHKALSSIPSPALSGVAEGLDDGIRQFMFPMSPYPCHIGPAPPAPLVIGNKLAAPLLTGSCNLFVGLWSAPDATSMNGTIAIGNCTGAGLTTESRGLLIGNYTTAPRGRDGFVNINNETCWWRDTGEPSACPPPVPECAQSAP